MKSRVVVMKSRVGWMVIMMLERVLVWRSTVVANISKVLAMSGYDEKYGCGDGNQRCC